MNERLRLLTQIPVLIVIFVFINYLYMGFITPPSAGDGIDYHIPIAKSILSGEFLSLPQGSPAKWYFPGSSNGILSLFILFGIPLGLYGVVAWTALLIALYLLGRKYNLNKSLSIIFAATVGTLYTIITRMLISQSIDLWLTLFFLCCLILLEKFRGRVRDFLLLGLFMGMIVGSKYTGPFFVVVLIIMYAKQFLSKISALKAMVFLIPFSFFGLFWYVRNFFLTGDPIYPQSFFIFRGDPSWTILDYPIWKATILYPLTMFNAYIQEYMVWAVVPFALALFVFHAVKKGKIKFSSNNKLILIGFINLLFYLFLPTDYQYNIFVSSFRYSYPAFIPLILGVFLIAKKYKREELLVKLALVNMLTIPVITFRAKLMFVYVILGMLYFLFEKRIGKILRLFGS